LLQATRVFLKFLFRGFQELRTVRRSIEALSDGPACRKQKSASETVRAIGPSTPSEFHALGEGQCGTRPGVGRKPNHVAEIAGIAQRGGEIAARRKAACRRRPRAGRRARGSARAPGLVVGIEASRRTQVEGVAAGGEIRQVCLARVMAPAAREALDDQVVLLLATLSL
jgi:hypothetical protein